MKARMKKLTAIRIIAVLALLVLLVPQANAQVVDIPDENLDAAIREELSIGPFDSITETDLAGLTSLDAHNRGITDLTGLEYCVNMTTLYLYENNISDISALSGLTKLMWLGLRINNISDITALEWLTSLEYLSLYENNISDISALSGLTKLMWLDLRINNISDITALEWLTNLEYLYLDENNISDISALSGLTKLGDLWLQGNNISDISALSELTSLWQLSLSENNVADISALSGLTNLRALYLYENNISDNSALSELTNLRNLRLSGNNISDIQPLVDNLGLDNGDIVFLTHNPLSYEAINADIPVLLARGVNVSLDDRTPTTLVKVSGDEQIGETGSALPDPFVVQVFDQNSDPFEGVPVSFSVIEGGGSMDTESTTVDVDGLAQATLTLGPSLGINTVEVTAADVATPVTFEAIAEIGSNLSPVATDDFVTTAMNTYVEFYILDNDFDPDGDPYFIMSVGSPIHGILLWWDPDGQCAYIPDEGFLGTDSFTYTISDGELSTTATVTITVIEPVTIKGTVKDNDTGKKLDCVQIIADSRQTQTDSKGRYELTGLAPGQITVKVSKAGYESTVKTVKNLEPGEKREVNLWLEPARLRLIIDTDPAMGDSDPDDITALIYAFQYASENPGLCEIVGITYGYGNFGDQILDADGTPGGEQMLRYYLLQINKMLEVLREGGVIDSYPDIRRGHKMSETWQNAGGPVPNGATEFMIEKVRDNPGQITIVALGTLTNIATAMAHYKKNNPNSPKEFLRDCKDLWWIGGNWLDLSDPRTWNPLPAIFTRTDRYNLGRDKRAAAYVFSNAVLGADGEPTIKMLPLFAATRWLLRSSDIDTFGNDPTRITDYLSFPLRWWMGEVHIEDNRQIDLDEMRDLFFIRAYNLGKSGFPPFDTIAMALALEPRRPDFVMDTDNAQILVDVDDGEISFGDNPSHAVRIIYDYDDDGIRNAILDQWGKKDQLSENVKFINCSGADHVIKYWEFGDKYEGPQDVSTFDPFSCYHLFVGVAEYRFDIRAKYRGRLFFDVPSFDGEGDNVKLHIYCDTKSQEPLTFLPYLNHKVEIYGCDAYSNSAIGIWNSVNNKLKYAGPTPIGTLQAWRTVNLGKDAAADLQNAKGGRFAILLAEQGDDTNCAWFDTSVDWKAYLECEFNN